MKLLLTAFCAAMITSPLAFAEKCEKGKCDKDKEESTMVAPCDKCDKHKKDEKKEDALLAEKCDKEKCDKDKEESTLLAA